MDIETFHRRKILKYRRIIMCEEILYSKSNLSLDLMRVLIEPSSMNQLRYMILNTDVIVDKDANDRLYPIFKLINFFYFINYLAKGFEIPDHDLIAIISKYQTNQSISPQNWNASMLKKIGLLKIYFNEISKTQIVTID